MSTKSERKTMYTVSRCRADDTLYGPSHASKDANSTCCGLDISKDWYITSNDYEGTVTCKKCLKPLAQPQPTAARAQSIE